MTEDEVPSDAHNEPEDASAQTTAPTAQTEILGAADAAEPDAPATGAPGPYRLGAVLGEGGMAVVYEAHDAALERSVAVKVLRPKMAADEEVRSRFLYEAKILGQMDHPGVVPVFAAGALGSHGPYYAMKKVRGRTLRQILQGMDKRDFQDAVQRGKLIDIFEKVCQTVAYAHAKGILHRDLKPENIMVDEFGVVLVLDWGLSKRIDVSEQEQGILATQVGTVKGTPAYMSPEQARGSTEEVDFRTDVFALGIVLYELLTGSLPFSGKSRTQVMQEILYREPAGPRKLNRRASRTLGAICMKALNKDREERYPSAAELAEDIQLHRDFLPTSAHRLTVLERLGNWVWRHTALAAALGTAVLVALCFGGFAWHRSDARRIRAAEEAERERLVTQLDEERRQQALQKSLLAIRRAMNDIRGFDDRILALKSDREQLGPQDTARRAQIDHTVAELTTARYMLTNSMRSQAVGIFAEMRAKAGDDASELDRDVMSFFRRLAVEVVQNYVRREDYYTAHYYLWTFTRQARESSIEWSEDQRAEFARLGKLVEAKLRERLGPDLPLPDWSKFSHKMLRREKAPSGPRLSRPSTATPQ